jgi:hypothetical protein
MGEQVKSEITDDELRTIRGDEPVAFYARMAAELLAARALIKTLPNHVAWREELKAYWKARGNDT